MRAPSSSGPGVQVLVSLSLETGRLVKVPPLGSSRGLTGASLPGQRWGLGTSSGSPQGLTRSQQGRRQSRGRGVWGLRERGGPAQTAQCLAQARTLAAQGPPSPTVCSQSQRSPEHPGGARRRLPPLIVPDNFILPAPATSHDVYLPGRSEARVQRSRLAEILGTWIR